VSREPEAFGDGDRIYPRPPDRGPGWDILGEFYEVNPRSLIGEGDVEMVRFWAAYAPEPGRIAGMSAGVLPVQGHLPEAGGFGDQAAVMLDAFAVMSAAWAEMRAGERQ
jgi:hypothetical protein